MEFITILLSSLLGLVSAGGLVIDRAAQKAIRSQVEVDRLYVRVDNAPSYQLLQGKVERVRIAGRNVQLKRQGIRVAALELETDPINLDLRSPGQKLRLKRPFQAGVRLVLTQEHINQALQSPEITTRLRNILSLSSSSSIAESEQSYEFVNPSVELLENKRLRFQVELQEQGNVDLLAITVESGLSVVTGRQIQLVEPVVSVNGEAVSNQIVSALATQLSRQLDLSKLDKYGLQARLLKLEVGEDELVIAAFLRVEPSSRFLENISSLI